MKKKSTLNNREQKRLLVLNAVLVRRMTGRKAAEMFGITLRHARRIMAKYRREGAAGLAHDILGERPQTR